MGAENKGFTLVEIIVGIVLLAVTLTIITGLLAPQAKQSAEPVIQVKATSLGQAVLTEILGRSFDEGSERDVPFRLCVPPSNGGPACTSAANLGTDTNNASGTAIAEVRATFDDVDDFIGGPFSGPSLLNSLGDQTGDQYPGFAVTINVVYDDNRDGVADAGTLARAKLITVTVAAPNNERYVFSAYKGNY